MPAQNGSKTFRWLFLSFMVLALACSVVSDANAISKKLKKAFQREGMTCTNCSDMVMQMLEYSTSLEQLTALRNQVSEAVMASALPSALPEGVIPCGMALVLAEHPGSFDGRYFGLVPLNTLQRAKAVWLWKP